MKIKKGTLPRFAKLCSYSGAFTVLSLASFSMVYYVTTPEVERFVRFLKSDAMWNWVQYNFFSPSALGLSLVFILATIAASSLGFVSAIFAEVMHDRAKDALKNGIGG